MKKSKSFHKPTVKLTGEEQHGLLVATFGAQAEIENSAGQIIHAHIRKNIEPVITGDEVLWQSDKNGTGIVLSHLPRQSLLYRPENDHKIKLIAANIDAIIIVTSPPPVLSENMIDRYLVAAENIKIQPVILLNKIDLLNDDNQSATLQRLAVYEKIGYKVIYSSTYSKTGLNQLDDFLQNKTCVLVGASGVGKSSIIAALTQEKSIKIGNVSESTQLGKHTTTTTRLYHLSHSGNLIDSPGVREFNLWHISQDELRQGFVEFKPYFNHCKFRNCQHTHEPRCAIKEAVNNQEIDEKRFLSYQKITTELLRKK